MDVWLPLGVALFGIIGTLAGVWITQRHADRREDDRRQFEHENRTFDHRRDAYLLYVQDWERFTDVVLWGRTGDEHDRSDPDMGLDARLVPLWNRLLAVRVYGTVLAHREAAAAFAELHDRASRGLVTDSSLIIPFIKQIRIDLAVPD